MEIDIDFGRFKLLAERLCDFFNKQFPNRMEGIVGEEIFAELVKPTWEGGAWKVVVKRADPKYDKSDPVFTIVVISPENIRVLYLAKWEKVMEQMKLELPIFCHNDETVRLVSFQKINSGGE